MNAQDGHVANIWRGDSLTISVIPRVFISSTCEDLREYREAAREAALTAGFFPLMMEYWTAGSNPPLTKCLDEVHKSDVLVVLIAHRYGWVPVEQTEGERKSITMLECEVVQSMEKEVLPFIVDCSTSWPFERYEEYLLIELFRKGELTQEKVSEIKDNIARLNSFKKEIKRVNIIKTFTSSAELKGLVVAALYEWLRLHPQFAGDVGPIVGHQDPTSYLRLLYAGTSFIDIRGLQVGAGRAHRFPIEDLYIPLTTTTGELGYVWGGKEEKDNEASAHADCGPIQLHEALRYKRLVIVGDPGSGKTTFLNRIAATLCESWFNNDTAVAKQRLGINDKPFPMLIRVRELADHIAVCFGKEGALKLANAAGWLTHFLAATSQDNDTSLEESFFREQLHAGKAIVLVDGIDEAPSQQTRSQMIEIIMQAASVYPKCRFVVTSRYGAYRDEAVLSSFDTVQIDSLDDKAINIFLENWCRALFGENVCAARDNLGEIQKGLLVPEIRRMVCNPLMLTALAVVNWNEKWLPAQRALLYESVITWLSRSREKRAGRTRAEWSVRILQKLAWAMQDAGDQRCVHVSKHWAAERIQEEFNETCYADRMTKAVTFLCEEGVDSGIIVVRGDDVFFWHLTFQEFLAACYLAAQTEQMQQKELLSQPKLYLSEWRETALLFAGVLYRQGMAKVNSMVAVILDALDEHALLVVRVRCIGLLGQILRDLSAYNYQLTDERYRKMLESVMAIFDREKSLSVPVKDAIETAEALSQAGDPRFIGDARERNWVRIKSKADFRMGAQMRSDAEPNYDPEADSDEEPVHLVYLSAYEIGRYPVTVGEFAEFMAAGGYAEEKWWGAGGFMKFHNPEKWEAQQAFLNRPVVGVSWFEASAYAAWAGCRLPSEVEWELAAAGPEGWKYPWGNQEATPELLNFDESRIGNPTPVGVYPRGRTPEGIDDIVGNVWEWCADWYENYPAVDGKKNPKGPESGTLRVRRGGCFEHVARECRTHFRDAVDPCVRWLGQGFRLVRAVNS